MDNFWIESPHGRFWEGKISTNIKPMGRTEKTHTYITYGILVWALGKNIDREDSDAWVGLQTSLPKDQWENFWGHKFRE